MVERLTGKDALSARRLEQEVGVPQTTLSRWLEEARSLPLVSSTKRTKSRTVDEKVQILAHAAKLSGEELSAYLAKNDLRLAEVEQWKLSLDEEGKASKATTRRIRELERELARKEKALAEAAALLVLKKKVHALWQDEDDDTDGESEK